MNAHIYITAAKGKSTKRNPMSAFRKTSLTAGVLYLLTFVFNEAPDWLTGGPFGLEGSMPGMFFLIIVTLGLYRRQPSHKVVL